MDSQLPDLILLLTVRLSAPTTFW